MFIFMKSLSPLVRHVLKSDFLSTFNGVENISSVDIFNWAINTQEFYKQFFDRHFYILANKAVAENRFHKYDRSYRPMFMEWTAWEVVPTHFHDFIAFGIVQSANLKNVNGKDIRVAADMIYDHYLKHFKENYL